MKYLNLFLSLFNIKFMKSTQTTKIIKSHAIANFMFCLSSYQNRPSFLLSKAITDNEEELNHFFNKLAEVDGNIFNFFFKLDDTNKEKLIRWISENYNGVAVENVARYYVVDESEVKDRLNCLAN